MKKIILIAVIFMLIIPIKANAFSWGDFFRALFGISTQETVIEKVSVKNDIEKTLNEYIDEASSIDKEVQSSFIPMVSIISGQNEAKLIKEKLNKANKIKDRAERTSAINQILNDYSTTINNNKLEIVVILKLLSESEKESLVKNINTIYDASDKYIELSKKNITLAGTTIKNATIEDERTILLNNINKLSEELAQSAKAVTTLSRQTKILASLSGIKN